MILSLRLDFMFVMMFLLFHFSHCGFKIDVGFWVKVDFYLLVALGRFLDSNPVTDHNSLCWENHEMVNYGSKAEAVNNSVLS